MPRQGDDPSILIGFETADDAAAVRLDGHSEGRILLQSVDFITPVVDDPFTFGQIAAANALSDIYAMGGRPLFALNIVGFPKDELPLDTLSSILAGGIDKAHEAGIHVIGGHTVDDPEPKYGLVVTGEVEERYLTRNSTAQAGDRLILTKPLGTGIIATAIKAGQAPADALAAASETMCVLNKAASEAALEVGVHAMTDITGYGLLGHLLEMCRASEVSAEITFAALPLLPGVVDLVKAGRVPGGTKRNLTHVDPVLTVSGALADHERLIAADAQTSGGLLLAVEPAKADALVAALQARHTPAASIIGQLSAATPPQLTLVGS